MDVLDNLIGSLTKHFSQITDPRKPSPNKRYEITDIALSAQSVFFLQSPSFLSHQQHLERNQGDSNANTLFGIKEIPTDNQIRSVLDRVDPKEFYPALRENFETLEKSSAISNFRVGENRLLIALDGTQYQSSAVISCPNCKVTNNKNGDITYSHSFLAASLVAPGCKYAIPLEPEFITPQDGHEKQDCENQAAKRWLSTHGKYYVDKGAIFIADDLYATEPLCKAVADIGGDFIFTAKATSHKKLYEYLAQNEPNTYQCIGKDGLTYTYRFRNNVPLNGNKDPLKVNWLELTVTDKNGKRKYKNAWVTNLPLTDENVSEIASYGKARWKIENETFNTLKTKGYNLEHNYGHGKGNLSSVLATMNLIAFSLHSLCDLLSDSYNEINKRIARRMTFFEEVRTLVKYRLFSSWEDLFSVMLDSFIPLKKKKFSTS